MDISGALQGSVIVKVVAGYDFYIAMTSSGTLYGWGNGYDGQIGAGVGTSFTPVAVSLNPLYNSALFGRTVAALECGRSSCNVITTDNQLIGWGENQYGSVGVGTAKSGVQYRVPIPALCLKGMIHSSKKMTTKLSVGLYHSVVLVENQLYAWGFNSYGQLGDNTQSKSFILKLTTKDSRYVPVMVRPSGILAGKTVSALHSGGHFNLVLTTGRCLLTGIN